MELFVYQKIMAHEEKDWWYRGLRNILLSYLKKFSTDEKGKVLDVGCGTGFLMKMLSEKLEVYGIDPSSEAIKLAQSKGLKSAIQASIEKIPFPDNYFGVVFCVDVLEHVKNDVKALKEMYRVLKPGGIAILNTPAYEFLWSQHDNSANHYRRYSCESLENKIKATHFKVLKLTYINSLLFPIALIHRLSLKYFFNSSVATDIDSVPGPIQPLFYKIFSFESYLLGKLNFPFGLSVSAVIQKPNSQDICSNGDSKEYYLSNSASISHNESKEKAAGVYFY